MRIAIIGDNNLSKAVNFGFPSNYCVKYNIDENAIETLPNYINYAFICIENIDRISDVITRLKTAINGHIILKSPILPENLTNLIKISSSIIYNPEFLNPKMPNESFIYPHLRILGGMPKYTNDIEYLYKHYSNCIPCPTFHMSILEAGYAKQYIDKLIEFNNSLITEIQQFKYENSFVLNAEKVLGSVRLFSKLMMGQ